LNPFSTLISSLLSEPGMSIGGMEEKEGEKDEDKDKVRENSVD